MRFPPAEPYASDDDPARSVGLRTRLAALAADLPFVPHRPYERRWLQLGWRAALISLLACLAFAAAVGAWPGPDERAFADPALHAGRGLLSIAARPFAGPLAPAPRALAWAETYVGGLGPAGVRATSVGLHAVACGFAWLAMRRLAVPGAWLAAAVAAVHPALLPTVAQPDRQADMLAAAAAAVAVWAYLSARGVRPDDAPAAWTDPAYHDADDADDADRPAPRARWAVFAVAAAVGLGCGSAVAVVMAGTLLAVERRERSATRTILLGALLAVTIVACFVLPYRGTLSVVGAAAALPWSAWHALVPVDGPFVYDRWQWTTPWTVAYACATAGLLVIAAMRQRGRAFVLAVAAGAVVNGLTAGGGPGVRAADLSSYATTAVVAAGTAAWCVTRLGTRRHATLGRLAVGVVLVGGLAWATRTRAAAYADGDAYWQHALAMNPDSAVARVALAARYSDEGFLDEAANQLDRVPDARRDAAWATARGRLFAERGESAEAADCFEKAYAQRPDDDTLLAWAEALNAAGRSDRAAELYDALLARKPADPAALVNAGLTQMRLGRPQAAIALYRRALAADADYVPGHVNLANALFDAGDYAEAASHLQRVVALDPRSYVAFVNSGVMLMRLGDPAKAERMFRGAVQIDPRSADAYAKLAAALAAQGKTPEAEWCLGQARRLAGGG